MKSTLKSLPLLIGLLMLVNVADAEPTREQPKQPGMLIVVPPLPPGSPITEAQLRKVLNDLARTGSEGALIPIIAKSFGLSRQGEAVRIRQIAFEDGKAIQYGFALLKDGSGYILDAGPDRGTRVALRLDENLKVVVAVAKTPTNEIAILSPADAKARLREVLAIWAEYADEQP